MKYLSESPFTHSIQIKKSDFITTLYHVETAQEAEAHIAKMKSDFPDATHHCSAYLINSTTLIKKAYDDGEPSKTAGIPILRSIEYSEFENILVIVTRYFGGIKLGAGGLIRAYSQAAREALLLAPYHTPKLYHVVELQGHIEHYGSLNNTLHSCFHQLQIDFTFNNDSFILTCTILDADYQQFQLMIKNQFYFIQFTDCESYYL